MTDNKKVAYKILKAQDKGWFSVKVNFDEMEQELNRLGQDGWDAVTSLDINHGKGRTKEVVILLKRYL